MEKLLSRFTAYLKIERNASVATISSYKPELEKFLYYLSQSGIEDIRAVTVSHIREYIYTIKEERGLSSVSTYIKIAIIKSFFNYLSSEGKIDKNPAAKIKLPRRQRPIPKVVSEADFSKILACIRFSPKRCQKNYIRDTLIFCMLYYCGLRRGELLALDWDDIDLEKDTLIVRDSKNKTARVIPIHPRVKELLEGYLAQRLPIGNRALFIGEAGSRLCKTSFSNIIGLYLKISGLEHKGYSAHSLRHYVERWIMGSEALKARQHKVFSFNHSP